MSSILSGGFARVATEEASWWTIASWARVLLFALVLVLVGVVLIGSTVVADSGIGRAVAFVDIVTETVAACALNERFGGNGDL